MFGNYFKIAWRNLIRNKSTTAINILGLAIGVSACLIIYLVTRFEGSFDTFHPDKERIYRVVADADDPAIGKFYMAQVPYPAALSFRNEFTGVEQTASFYSYSAKTTIPDGNKTPRKFKATDPSEIIIPEPAYFSVFRYEWLAGNAGESLDRPFRVVLTESKARLYFGSIPVNEIIGKEVIYDDSLRLTVSGIVKDWNKNSDLIFKEFISFSTIQNSFLRQVQGLQGVDNPDNWAWPDYAQTFVKLAKGTTPAQFEAQTARMVKEQMSFVKGRKTRLRLQPLSDIHFDANYRDFYSGKAHLPTLYGLMGIAAFILIIAAINFINLSTAQSLHRAKEIGIRKVLGSSRASLVWQFLTEAFILTCLSVILSLLIVRPVLAAFQAFIPNGIVFDLGDPFTWAFLVITTILTSLLAGFYPARMLSSYLPALALKGQAKGAGKQKNYLRKGLIVFQFTISLVFIIGTIVIGSQTRYLLDKDMGFIKEGIITINTSGNYPTNKRNILAEKIRQLPGVDMASVSVETPVITRLRGGFLTRKDNGKEILCSERVGDEYYAPLFGLKVIAGRNFTMPQDDTAGLIPTRIPWGFRWFSLRRAEILINETCARLLGFKKPEEAIGHWIEDQDSITGPIVGVVADFHSRSLFTPIGPAYIYGSKRLLWGNINVKLSTQGKSMAQFRNTLAAIEKSCKKIYPDEPFEYQFFDQTIAGFYGKEQQTAQITNAAMMIAIFISCMGLFGLVTFTAEQRTKEIGIRKVLGASVSSIVAMLSKDFLALVVLAIVIASPIAWYFLHRWLQDFAYRITISWWIFALAGLSAMLIALITVSFRAIKAAIANPVKSLRAD